MFERTRLLSAALLAATLCAGGAAQAQPRPALPTYYDPHAPAYDPCACTPQGGYYAQPQSGQSWSYSQSYNWSGQPAPYGYAQPLPVPPPPAYGQPGYGQPGPAPQGDAFTYYNPGQSAWCPGLLLPPNLRGYKIDYYYRSMGKPRRGYAWYKIGNEYILASTETGEIVTIMTFPN